MEARECSPHSPNGSAFSKGETGYCGVRSCTGCNSSSLCDSNSATNRWTTIYKNQGKFPPGSTWVDSPDPHFLDACFLCKRRLRQDRDIFMYRGDVPFCSEECREEQIKSDEVGERKGVFFKAALVRKGRKNRSSPRVELRAQRPAVAG